MAANDGWTVTSAPVRSDTQLQAAGAVLKDARPSGTVSAGEPALPGTT